MSTTPKRLGKYELRERLGHGGVAEVWKAYDTQLQRFVAIKVLQPNLRDDPNFASRFQREAQLIASLHHPNIVQIHDFQIFQPDDEEKGEGSEQPLAYMVMDYVEGQTLADFIRNTSSKGQIPSPFEIVNLFASISLAIDYAHQQGMIHRDIKPANILLDQRNTARNPMGEPILTDFGVAKMLSASSNTMSGAQLGTPLYISPEQARGYPGNERSDLYSLGIILYEMVTGVTPFRGDTPIDVIAQHINATPISPALINHMIPPTLTQVIMRSISKDPNLRFASASSMTAAIAEALNIPLPEGLGQAANLLDSSQMATQIGRPAAVSQPMQPSYPNPVSAPGVPNPVSAPGISNPVSAPGISAPIYGAATPTPSMSGFASTGGQGAYTPNANLTPIMLSTTPATPYAPGGPPPGSVAPPQAPFVPQKPRRKHTVLYAILIPLLILIVLGTGLGAYLYLNNRTTLSGDSVVGQAFYTSSGQLDLGNARGIADQMKIDLHGVPAAQSGKSYYAWLLPDRTPEKNPDLTGPRPIAPPILLTNNLPVRNGVVDYTYLGDSNHNNLISTTSRLLITEEAANQTPSKPSSDRTTWRYYAEIPQGQIPGDDPGFSALVHIRHLFYNETNIKVKGLFGGLDIWMFRNTEKLLEWAVSARDDWHGADTTETQRALMADQFVRILDYLDGIPNRQVDMPANTPVLVDRNIASVALLTVDKQHQGSTPAQLEVNPPGYVDHVQLHVSQVSKATDISPELRKRSASIIDSVNRAGQWLTNVHSDARKLFQMRNDLNQMKQNTTGELLDDMVTQATYAYIGQLDPTTNTVKGGILQAHYDIQQMAVLTLTKKLPDSI